MTHVVEDAKKLLQEARAALEARGAARVADAVLLLPRVSVSLDQLIVCVELLGRRTEADREELRVAIQALRSEVWHINDEVARLVGEPGGLGIPAGPISVKLRRCITAIDAIESKVIASRNC